MPTPVIIMGPSGRMGKELVALASNDASYELVGTVDEKESLLTVLTKNKGAIVDFTSPQATLENLRHAVSQKAPYVIGTTGFDKKEKAEIEKASREIPVILSPNMSVGVNALFKLISEAARILGDKYDIEVTEAHHRLKKDSPSGTAVRIGEILAKATGLEYPNDFNFHREGMIGERKKKEIGMQVIRGGDIVGDHTVMYCGDGERLEIKHVATSRKTFAAGALRAAAWAYGKPAGLYDMHDVLGL